MITMKRENGKLVIEVDLPDGKWLEPEELVQSYLNQQKSADEPLEKTLQYMRDCGIALRSLIRTRGENYARKMVSTHTVRREHLVILPVWTGKEVMPHPDALPEGTVVVFWDTKESDQDSVYKD